MMRPSPEPRSMTVSPALSRAISSMRSTTTWGVGTYGVSRSLRKSSAAAPLARSSTKQAHFRRSILTSNHSFLAQRGDLRIGKSRFAQDLVGVLARFRRASLDAEPELAEFQRERKLREPALVDD